MCPATSAVKPRLRRGERRPRQRPVRHDAPVAAAEDELASAERAHREIRPRLSVPRRARRCRWIISTPPTCRGARRTLPSRRPRSPVPGSPRIAAAVAWRISSRRRQRMKGTSASRSAPERLRPPSSYAARNSPARSGSSARPPAPLANSQVDYASLHAIRSWCASCLSTIATTLSCAQSRLRR